MEEYLGKVYLYKERPQGERLKRASALRINRDIPYTPFPRGTVIKITGCAEANTQGHSHSSILVWREVGNDADGPFTWSFGLFKDWIKQGAFVELEAPDAEPVDDHAGMIYNPIDGKWRWF